MFDTRQDSTPIPLREIYSVSRLNQETRSILEGSFPLLWVEGEISNLARPSSGHLYFCLKDQSAQVRCALFRQRNMYLGFTPANGMQVVARAQVSLYEGRGEFQLIVEHLEEAGDGALRRAFEALKQRLALEGLFDSHPKKALPLLPSRIGIITSPSGAAVRDILCCLKRRFPGIPVIIYPVPVQGHGAAEKIARVIQLAAQRAECDVLILARGGGSLEDLWAFNEEVVARAIYHCTLPLVTGIGHEIDFTIADLVADRRAATPSVAAEVVTPDQQEWQEQVERLARRLALLMRNNLNYKKQAFELNEKRLQHPGQRLRAQAQRLDELEQRLLLAQQSFYRHNKARLAELNALLRCQTPVSRLRELRNLQTHLLQRLSSAFDCMLTKSRTRFESATRTLDAVSPLATLARGYAILELLPQHAVVRTIDQVSHGDRLEARLGQGRLHCIVDKLVDE